MTGSLMVDCIRILGLCDAGLRGRNTLSVVVLIVLLLGQACDPLEKDFSWRLPLQIRLLLASCTCSPLCFLSQGMTLSKLSFSLFAFLFLFPTINKASTLFILNLVDLPTLFLRLQGHFQALLVSLQDCLIVH